MLNVVQYVASCHNSEIKWRHDIRSMRDFLCYLPNCHNAPRNSSSVHTKIT